MQSLVLHSLQDMKFEIKSWEVEKARDLHNTFLKVSMKVRYIWGYKWKGSQIGMPKGDMK